MGFGTFQNELNLQSKFEFKSKKKNLKRSNKNNQLIKVEKTEIKSEPMVMFPQLPENWTKKTITGDSSYDTTMIEINKQLKRTMVFREIKYLKFSFIYYYKK